MQDYHGWHFITHLEIRKKQEALTLTFCYFVATVLSLLCSIVPRSEKLILRTGKEGKQSRQKGKKESRPALVYCFFIIKTKERCLKFVSCWNDLKIKIFK